MESLAKVEEATCMRFIQGVNSEGNYVRVTDNEEGCWSYVGYLHKPGQQLNIGYGCDADFIIIHEFLHAAGFQHQQCSYERDDYVELFLENVEPDMRFNFDKYTEAEVTNFGTRYDYDSIMHYDAYAFSMNGKKVMVPKFLPEGENMGLAEELSPTYNYKIDAMYNCH